MPFIHDCSQTKGQAEPASAYLSPVARDYPNRALRGFFMPTALRLFHQRTGRNVGRAPGEVTTLFYTTYSPAGAVNNLPLTLRTVCSRPPRNGFDTGGERRGSGPFRRV